MRRLTALALLGLLLLHRFGPGRTGGGRPELAPGGRVVALEGSRLYYPLDDTSPRERYLLAALSVE